MTSQDHDPLDALGQGVDRLLPDNSSEYQLFIINRSLNVRQHLARLEEVRREATRLCIEVAGQYIWQKEEFHLVVKTENGLSFLHGTTDYGDSVDDEWLIVYLLRQLTLTFPDLWVHVHDSDGEFLLVEGASAVPSWITPEIDRFRVWLYQGKLLVLPPDHGPAPGNRSGKDPRVLSLDRAIQEISARTEDPKRYASTNKKSPDSDDSISTYGLYYSTHLETEAFYRLRNFPGHLTQMLHYSLVTIPRKLAYIIHNCPKSLAPAVEEFYLRDPVSLKPILTSTTATRLTFPPRNFVTTSVKFSRVLFAQLRSQRFETPGVWEGPLTAARRAEENRKDVRVSKERMEERLNIGMKLTVGYEMMVRKVTKSDNRLIREVGILLEDLEEDGGDEALPSVEEITKWEGADQEDDDGWLDIDFTDFEREFEGKGHRDEPTNDENSSKTNKESGFGDANAQESLRKIVSRFENFLNDEGAGIDGLNIGDEMDVDNDSDNGESDWDSESAEEGEVTFDEDAITAMMKRVLGISPESTTSSAASTAPAVSTKAKMKAAKDDEDAQDLKAALEMMQQMEAELKGHGALTLSDPSGLAVVKGKRPAKVMESGEGSLVVGDDDEDEDEDEDGELNIDLNLATNLLESFKSQGGVAGPAGNLLGLMGFQLPRDAGESDGEEGKGKGNENRIRR